MTEQEKQEIIEAVIARVQAEGTPIESIPDAVSLAELRSLPASSPTGLKAAPLELLKPARVPGATPDACRAYEWFDGTKYRVTVDNYTTPNKPMGIYYDEFLKIFVAEYFNGKYCNDWPGAHRYMNPSRTEIIKDKVYLFGARVFAWDDDVQNLIAGDVEESDIPAAEVARAMNGATARFDTIDQSGEIYELSTRVPYGEVVWVADKCRFAYRPPTGATGAGILHKNWPEADMFMNPLRTELLKDKMYLYGRLPYVWDEVNRQLIPVAGKLDFEQINK